MNPNTDRDERVRQSVFVVLSDKEVTRIGSQIVSDVLAQMGVRGTREEREGADIIAAAWVSKIVERATEELNANDAATRMREACVEKVREIDSPSDTATDFDVAYRNGFESARDAAIEALQSLTLEQGEQEKPK